MSASDRLTEMLEPIGRASVAPDEELRGVLAASEVGMFSGHTRAVVVTDRRLLIQGVDRHWHAKGEPLAITPGDLAEAKVTGLGDDWYNTAISLANHSGYTVRLKLADGRKLKLMAMSGEGKLLGALGGGEFQARGAQALLEWLQAQSSASRASL